MARKATKKLVDEGYSKLDAWAIGVHEMYRSLRRAGFEVDLALAIIVERQAYPEWIGSAPNISRGNAIDTLLPGNCIWEDKPNGSSKYRIAFSRPHTSSQLLVQMNDALRGSYCEKSWSIDNILIEAITN